MRGNTVLSVDNVNSGAYHMNMRSYKCCEGDKRKIGEVDNLSVLLKLISDKNRLKLLCILQNGEHCVCELMEHINLSQSLISHHLKDLKEFALLSKRSEGKWSYYSLTQKGTEITNLIFKIKT